MRIHITNMRGQRVHIGKTVLQSWDAKKRMPYFSYAVGIVYAGTNVDALANPDYHKPWKYRCRACKEPVKKGERCVCGRGWFTEPYEDDGPVDVTQQMWDSLINSLTKGLPQPAEVEMRSATTEGVVTGVCVKAGFIKQDGKTYFLDHGDELRATIS